MLSLGTLKQVTSILMAGAKKSWIFDRSNYWFISGQIGCVLLSGSRVEVSTCLGKVAMNDQGFWKIFNTDLQKSSTPKLGVSQTSGP